MTTEPTKPKRTRTTKAPADPTAGSPPKTKAPEPTILERLSAPFPAKEVKQREGSKGMLLDFISIDSTIRRLLEVTPGYETSDLDVKITGPIPTTKVNRRTKEEFEVDLWAATVSLTMHVPLEDGIKRHVGVGSDVDEDLDKVTKTALAEALKKAGHQVGVGLYLWLEEERDLVARQRELQGGDPAALKREIVRLAVAGGVELGTDAEENAQKLADFFQVPVESMQDMATLKGLAGVE